MAAISAIATQATSTVGLKLSVSGSRPRPSQKLNRSVVCNAEPVRKPGEVAAAPTRPSSSTKQRMGVAPMTVEEQRKAAKAMIAYFQDADYEKTMQDSKILGFTSKNEIGNGRWAMFGLAVGLLTEYATGVDFVDQVRIIISNLGIADVY